MEILIKDNNIAKAHNAYKRFTEDDNLREAYESRLKWKLDYNTDIEYAKQEGVKEGLEKGELLNSQKILINLLKSKFSKSLTEDDVKLILKVDKIENLENTIQYVLSAKNKNDVLKKL